LSYDYSIATDDCAGETDLPLDSHPTKTIPGTEERILAYADRASRGKCIFHPGDSKMPAHLSFKPVHDRAGNAFRGHLLQRVPGTHDHVPVVGHLPRAALVPSGGNAAEIARKKRCGERNRDRHTTIRREERARKSLARELLRQLQLRSTLSEKPHDIREVIDEHNRQAG
jgi:hypothetical protein